MHWRRKWQPTPVFLPGESQGWGSLVGCVYRVAQSRTRLKRLSSSSSSISKVTICLLWHFYAAIIFPFFFLYSLKASLVQMLPAACLSSFQILSHLGRLCNTSIDVSDFLLKLLLPWMAHSWHIHHHFSSKSHVDIIDWSHCSFSFRVVPHRADSHHQPGKAVSSQPKWVSWSIATILL